MVIENAREVLALLPVLFAGLAAIGGIVVLEGFFRNKLKELFDDLNYFIFFFLVSGYFLYGLGEVSFYLTKMVFKDNSPIGIADFYWSAGSLLILISFIALAVLLFRQYPDKTKLTLMAVFGAALLAFVVSLLFGVTLREGESTFFAYVYPIMSSLIVAFSSSVVFFSRQLEQFRVPLLIFFLASGGILLGDLLFTYATAKGIYLTGLIGSLADGFYSAGYALSGIAFIALRSHLNLLAFRNG